MTIKVRTTLQRCLTVGLLSLASSVWSDTRILTDVWPPYINSEHETAGSAAKLVNILLDRDQLTPNWHYLPYDISFHRVKSQQSLLAFPYFKTKEREESVAFSDPVFSVTSRIYYNRQYLNQQQAEHAYREKLRMGKVAGYSYGSAIDEEVKAAKIFASEEQALTALLNHDIDLLPMTEGVMEYQLNNNFPLRKQLIVAIKSIADTSSLHVIAANNEAGKTLIKVINNSLATLDAQGMESLKSTTSTTPAPVDVARLITSEGYPLIMGQSHPSGEDIQYFTLPQGTQALIIQWSEKILQPSTTDRIYKNMMDLSKVVILNGPHVGKELFVRNMHIELL